MHVAFTGSSHSLLWLLTLLPVIGMAANTYQNPTWILKNFTARVANMLKFAANANRDYDDQFVVKGAKVGDTVYARIPQLYAVNDGDALVEQAIADNTVPVTITDHIHVGVSLTAREQMLNEDNFLERYVYPAADAMANAIDQRGLSRMTKKVYNTVGTPGSNPTSNATWLNAGVKLDQLGTPAGEKRYAIWTANMSAGLMNTNTAVFNPGAQISAGWKKGTVVGPALNIDEYWKDENAYRHLTGTQTGSPTVNGANQTGSSVIIQSASNTATFKDGDVVQFAGCNAVNPLSKQNTGQLADFVVNGDQSANAAGAITLNITPSIVVTGAQQNVTASPTNAGAVTIFGNANTNSNTTTAQGLVFTKPAFALVMADAPLYKSAAVAERIQEEQLGLSFTMHKQFDIRAFSEPARIDAFFGWAAIRPEFACRVCGAAQ